MAPASYKVLTPSQVSFFLDNGYVVIPQAFSPKQAEELTSDVWTRLGYSPTDKETWLSPRVNMPWHKRFQVQEWAPKAWDAMSDLLGGEDRIDQESATWSDGFICNFGSEKLEEQWEEYQSGKEGVANPNDPKSLDNWHVDGDFFIHFLDSREQGLLVIPLFSDVVPNGGATMISPDGIGRLALWLMDHPDGVSPRMKPVETSEDGSSQDHQSLTWYQETINKCSDFRQMTGTTGDLVLMHPLMLHSASRNVLRKHRIITNPAISVKEPFNFNRANPDDYSLVERKTLRELGKMLKAEGRITDEKEVANGLNGWKITGERRRVVPARLKIQAEMKRKEEARLRGEQIEANKDGGRVFDDAGVCRDPGMMMV